MRKIMRFVVGNISFFLFNIASLGTAFADFPQTHVLTTKSQQGFQIRGLGGIIFIQGDELEQTTYPEEIIEAEALTPSLQIEIHEHFFTPSTPLSPPLPAPYAVSPVATPVITTIVNPVAPSPPHRVITPLPFSYG